MFKIRNYVRAKSEKRLRSLMLRKQLELKMAFDITYAKGYWFAWYYEVAKDEIVIQIESENNGNTKDN